MKQIFIFFIMLLLVALNGCKSIFETKRMADCVYEFHSVEKITLAGVKVGSASKLKDLAFPDLAKITQSYLSGTLPAKFTANISIQNPNKKLAALEKMEWKMFVEDVEIVNGVMDKRVEIGAGLSTIMPIDVELNLMTLLKDESKKELLNFALNLADAGGTPTKLSIKIKPSVRVGGVLIATPNFFTVNTSVGK